MDRAAVARGPTDTWGDTWEDAARPSRSTPYGVSASVPETALTPISPWGVQLRPGQAFIPGQVGAIITSEGLFVWAMPGQYFDTTPGGVRIRLRRFVAPEPTTHDPTIAQWNAVGQVARIVMAAELRNRREGAGSVALPPPDARSNTANPAKGTGRRSFWLQGLIAVALVAALIVTYLLETRSDPATAEQWLLALIGLGGLMIFGVAAAAIIQAATL